VDEAAAGRYLPFIGPDNITPAAHTVYSFFRTDFNFNRPPYSLSGYILLSEDHINENDFVLLIFKYK
ncbi:hypothetical protein, partial [Enterobacter sp. TUM13743]|uniref:hypothetical protein n=1 Tax=Enterobacter sp. TUM13743 TaxID=2004400 RepID=UPI001BAFD376